MKVSVITPSYNQGKFIDRCIASVKQQDDVEIEHIILDNCSTDSTRRSLRRYHQDPAGIDLKVFVERDSGQTDAINRGFSMATGDVVCWLNTDEWYAAGTLAKVVSFFIKHADLDVLYGNCEFLDAQTGMVRKRKGFPFSRSMLLYYGCYIPSCSTFVRRSVIDSGLLLDSSLKVTMDYEWYLRIDAAGYRIGYLPETFAYFTWHDNNISTNFERRRKAERLHIQNTYSRIPGPAFARRCAYPLLKYYWKGTRFVGRLSSNPRPSNRSVIPEPGR